MVGPFWPCLLGVTYPLILGVSLFSAVFLLPDAPSWAIAAWAVCTVTLVAALTLTACTNPGIVRRYKNEPPPNTVCQCDPTAGRMNFACFHEIFLHECTCSLHSFRPLFLVPLDDRFHSFIRSFVRSCVHSLTRSLI